MNWDTYFISMADTARLKSKDRSTTVGAVIVRDTYVVATGWNGFPRGINDDNPAYHERPMKYCVTEHAERNAIYNAAAEGAATAGCIMYITHNPSFGICTDCARAIIQSRIVRVVGPSDVFTGKGAWDKDLVTAHHMLVEAMIEVYATSDRLQGEPAP
jgi:dCMP deaminase